MKKRLHTSVIRLAFVAGCLLCSLPGRAQWIIVPSITHAVCDEAGGKKGAVSVVVSGILGPYTYSWSTGGTTDEEQNLSGGYVTVDVKNSIGNDTSATFWVPQDNCDPAPAQVFTPNGDGIHDDWIIGNASLYPNMLVLVYNRWGQLIYQNKGRYQNWDGKSLLGTPVDEATYYYIIYENAGDRGQGIVQGAVTIMR